MCILYIYIYIVKLPSFQVKLCLLMHFPEQARVPALPPSFKGGRAEESYGYWRGKGNPVQRA